jgi:hypothetical protein
VNKKPNNIAVNKTPPIMIKLKKSNLLAWKMNLMVDP